MHRITTAQKIRKNFTPTQVYLLQQSYSLTSVEKGPKFGQIIQQDKPTTTYQNLVKIYHKTSLLLQHSYSQTSVELEPKFGQIIQQDKPNTTAQLLPDFSGVRAKIWSNFTTRLAYRLLQQSLLEFTSIRTYIFLFIIYHDSSK